MRLPKAWIWVALSVLSHSVFGQSFSQKHYGVKDGLPSSTVYAITQDQNGFMWFGTEAGLTRFDGTEFKTFTTKDGLLDNEVISLTTDGTGRMWVTAYKKGICYWYKGKFYTRENDPLIKSLPLSSDDDLTIVIAGNKNRCWVYSRILSRIIGDTVKVFPELPLEAHVRWVEDISDTEFNVFSFSSVYRFINDSLVSIDNLNTGTALNDMISFGVFDKYITAAVGGYLNVLERMPDHHFNLLLKKKLEGNTFNELAYQSNHMTMLGNRCAISALNLGTYLLDLPLSESSKVTFIPNHSTSLFQDKDNNVWAATSDNGIFVYRPQNFFTINHMSGLTNENVGCIYADNPSHIWVGDGKGTIQQIINGTVSDTIAPKEKIPFTRSRKIIKDDGRVYFISDSGCWVYDPATNQYQKVPTLTSTKSMILSRKRDRLIIGTARDLIFAKKQPPFSAQQYQVERRIMALCEDTSGRLYCGSNDGLYEWTDTLVHIATSPLLKNRISSMALSSKYNILWIGTSSDGVVAYKDGKVIGNINHSTNNSFTGAICRSLFVDEKNHLWVTTNNGLNKIHYTFSNEQLNVTHIIPFFTSDGLADDDVNDVYAKDSMVYVATSKGVTVFNYNKLAAVAAPPVYIISVSIGQIDTTVLPSYTLPYQQNNITIGFAGLSFTSIGKLTYRYLLKGADTAWTYTDVRQVELKSLHYGEYTFMVQALDKFGNPSVHAAAISIIILPPFYVKWWFLILSASLFAFSVYAITIWWYSRRRSSENSLNEMKEKIGRLEQKALRAQMNPHFIFNSLTAIQYFINSEDAESANKYLGNFAKLIRITLENSSENTITVAKEIQYLENYVQLEQMRFDNTFTYSIACDRNVDKANTYLPVMLTQPYIENAIRHGLRNKNDSNLRLTVIFYMQGNILVCEIDDNGIGREMAALLKTGSHIEYQSKGMKISSDRIEAMNNMNGEKIQVEIIDKKTTSEISEGTKVILYFHQNLLT